MNSFRRLGVASTYASDWPWRYFKDDFLPGNMVIMRAPTSKLARSVSNADPSPLQSSHSSAEVRERLPKASGTTWASE